jgi:hypothetical protein
MHLSRRQVSQLHLLELFPGRVGVSGAKRRLDSRVGPFTANPHREASQFSRTK